MRTALGQRDDVVHLLRGGDLATLLAPLTQRVGSDEVVTDPLPRPAVTFLHSRVTLVAFVTLGFLLGMLLTEAYLGGGHDRLFTADIICHGVTSASIFNDYVRAVEKADHVQIVAYQFRDKEISWGTNFSYRYRGSNGQVKTRHLPREASSYMSHYLRGNIFRENCYRCTLANTSRVSDITLGDFWEIEKTHPALVLTARPRIRLKKGVSCILVNTVRGRELLQKAMPKMILYQVDIPSVIEHNGNLRASSKKGVERESVLETWKTAGYEQIEADYRSRIRKKKRRYLLKNVLKSHLPDWLRVIIFRRFY